MKYNTFNQSNNNDLFYGDSISDALSTIAAALKCRESDIFDISVLKKGMSNKSFLFRVKDTKYILRIPGEGTDKLVNRKNEATVFNAIKGLGLCDNPVYINPENGYKISVFLEKSRVCDAYNSEDIEKSMRFLRRFHEMKIVVPHSFDLFNQIEFYESLQEGKPSAYRDYAATKNSILSLRQFISRQQKDCCLTHIDAVPDNFLFYQNDGKESLQLTDWEYAGMQDPHLDIAMFCIYSLYEKNHVDNLINIYFEGKCDCLTRAKIYCYMATGGLLWSNWCEYKQQFGINFGEYSSMQYNYAKDYFRYASELIP